jgi:predicted nuclease of restriction endonuclease-like (RecB) superfamily
MVAEIDWTHNLVILEKCKDDLEREFYLRMAHKFGWTKKVLPIRLFLDISDIQRSGYV